MPSLNRIMVIGNVGKAPELRYTPGGKPVADFSLATNRTYTADGEKKKETEWFDVIVWDKQAENCCQYVTKGQQIYVEGRLHTRTWDGNDGQKHFKVEIHASQVLFLGKPEGAAAAPETTEEKPFE